MYYLCNIKNVTVATNIKTRKKLKVTNYQT